MTCSTKTAMRYGRTEPSERLASQEETDHRDRVKIDDSRGIPDDRLAISDLLAAVPIRSAKAKLLETATSGPKCQIARLHLAAASTAAPRSSAIWHLGAEVAVSEKLPWRLRIGTAANKSEDRRVIIGNTPRIVRSSRGLGDRSPPETRPLRGFRSPVPHRRSWLLHVHGRFSPWRNGGKGTGLPVGNWISGRRRIGIVAGASPSTRTAKVSTTSAGPKRRREILAFLGGCEFSSGANAPSPEDLGIRGPTNPGNSGRRRPRAGPR